MWIVLIHLHIIRLLTSYRSIGVRSPVQNNNYIYQYKKTTASHRTRSMAELIQYANGVPGIKWPLDKAIVRIGRSDSNNDISVDDAFASKVHAQIEIVVNDDEGGLDYYVRDLHSTNHTYLNQAPIEHTRLSHNDTLVIGKSKFVFLCEGVREYVSRELLDSYSSELASKQSEESLSTAVEEITEQFKKPADSDLVTTVYSSESGRYKFSRRLNFY